MLNEKKIENASLDADGEEAAPGRCDDRLAHASASLISGTRFAAAIRRFDEENARDPNTAPAEGGPLPYELFYAQRLTEWVLRLCPDASEALLLAARGQHLCRWMIPRSSYEMTRAGYLKWRADLKEFHARQSAEILQETGYPRAMIERVRSLNLKRDLGRDPEVQVLEDALCLVTLQHQLGDLLRKTEPEKLVTILRKTWKKCRQRRVQKH